MAESERVARLETILAALIDYIDAVGCYDQHGERLDDQIPVLKQARMILGDDAWRRVIDVSELDNPTL